jgi:hypothetical protein
MKESDEVDKLIEWQEHQNNPGYWINHRPFFEPPKRSPGFFIVGLIDVILLVPTFLFTLMVFLQTRSRDIIYLLIALGVFSVLAVLRAIRLRPLEKVEKSQTELDAIRQAEKKEKKAKHNNKPKNYH